MDQQMPTPMDDQQQMVTCPHCGAQFVPQEQPVEAQEPQPSQATAALAQAMSRQPMNRG